MSGDSRPDLDPASPKEPWLLRQIAGGLLGSEALITDLNEGHLEPARVWSLIDDEMAGVTGWLQMAPPQFARAAKLAWRYQPHLSPRRKHRLLVRIGTTFFAAAPDGLAQSARERNQYQQARRARQQVQADRATERLEELHASAVGSVEVLHGLVTSPEPDWPRVRELASLVATLADELAGAFE